jgi:hypothetical protein
MKVLDLFSGSGSFSQAFKDRGHDVTTVDIEPGHHPDIVADVIELQSLPDADMIMGGFPCECFSVASIGTHWGGGRKAYLPQTPEAWRSIALVEHTLDLIDKAAPIFYMLENPRGVARKIFIERYTCTVWYCQYGDERAKPTDLFGHLPPSFVPKTCHNGVKDHAEARRGAKTGTQGRKGAYERSKVPYRLSLELCLAAENDLA